MLNTQQKDEIDALQKKLQTNKSALDAMKKILDNEKAFRICADQEIKNLKEQIKCSANKYKSLENENEKLTNEKLKIEDAKKKINLQCNELIEKNISLENHCEKKEAAFDEQTKLVSQLEDNITELNEKINNFTGIEEENNKLLKQIKSFSKQMESYENEREVYVQRLQKMQKEENNFTRVIKDLKKEIDAKNNKINDLNESNSDLSSTISRLNSGVVNVQINFTNCLKLLDDFFENYVNNQINKKTCKDNDDLSIKLKPFLNEAFEVVEQTLTEYQVLKSFCKESETIFKDEVKQKEKMITLLNDKIDCYKQEIIKYENTKTPNATEGLSHCHASYQLTLNDELERNLVCVNEIKTELLHKQRLLLSDLGEFIVGKVKEIENLNVLKNNYINNITIKTENLKKEIVDKNEIIKELKQEVLKLEERITVKDALCNEMEIELQNFKDNLGLYFI